MNLRAAARPVRSGGWTAWRRAARGLLLAAAALAWAGSLAAQGGLARPRLFTRPPGSTDANQRIWLVPGTEFVLFRERAPDGRGRAFLPDSAPARGNMPRDSIGAAGTTVAEYEAGVGGLRDRYLIYARTPDGKLYWSVEPRQGAQPYFHTLDNPPLIRMAEVPAPQQARVSALFPPRPRAPAPPSSKQRTERPAAPPTDDTEPTGWTDHPLALLTALLLGLAGGWLLRHGGLGRDLLPGLRGARRYESAGMSLPPAPQSTVPGGGGHMETAYPRPARRDPDDGYHRSGRDAYMNEPVPAGLDDRLKVLQSELGEELSTKVSRLEGIVIKHFDRIEERLRVQSLAAQPSSSSAAVATASPAAASVARGTRGQVAEAFVDWCRTAGPNVHRIQDFGDEIGRRLGRAAEVSRVVRDGDTNGIMFVTNGAGDPIDYWLVTMGRDSMVLPRPLEDGFRELHPVYAGNVMPPSLRSITPALVRPDGTGWILEQRGEVT